MKNQKTNVSETITDNISMLLEMWWHWTLHILNKFLCLGSSGTSLTSIQCRSFDISFNSVFNTVKRLLRLAPVPRYFGPLLLSKLLEPPQVWRVPSPHCVFQQLLPQMFNRIWIRAHTRPLQRSPLFCSKPWPATGTKLCDTGALMVRCSDSVSLEVVLGCLVTVCIICRLNLSSPTDLKLRNNVCNCSHREEGKEEEKRLNVELWEQELAGHAHHVCNLSASFSTSTHGVRLLTATELPPEVILLLPAKFSLLNSR